MRTPTLPCALAVIVSAAGCAADRAEAQYLPGPRASQDCQLQSGGESAVLAVASPQTLQLADGRFVRLAEILAPPASAAGFDPSAAAAAYLREAALGRKVEVKFGGAQRDRYGVYTGHVFVQGASAVWLQEGLVKSGFAIAAPQTGNHACAAQLVAAEAAARQANSGHWGLGVFKVLNASDPRSVLNLAGSYQIVEGATASASESGGRIALRFGAENKFGFTASIEPAAKRRFADKQSPENWSKLTIRLRGWIEKRRGPSLSIALPEQVELLPQRAAQ